MDIKELRDKFKKTPKSQAELYAEAGERLAKKAQKEFLKAGKPLVEALRKDVAKFDKKAPTIMKGTCEGCGKGFADADLRMEDSRTQYPENCSYCGLKSDHEAHDTSIKTRVAVSDIDEQYRKLPNVQEAGAGAKACGFNFLVHPHDYVSPNRDRLLCRDCAKEHHEHWDAMWDEYASTLRF